MGKDEPQSYGSERDWVTGQTGQTVTQQKSEPQGSQAPFYDSSLEVHPQDPVGGLVSDVQLSEKSDREIGVIGEDELAARRVTDLKSGARRDSFFKDRDYPR